jgi:SAM-dependent methyltransferase
MLLTETETMTRCTYCGEKNGDPVVRMGDPYLSRPDTFEMLACGSCGLVRTRQLPADLPRWYEEHYSEAQRLFHSCESKVKAGRPYRILDRFGVIRLVRKLNLNHHRFIAAQIPATGRVLEVGCGTGDILRLLKARGAEVFGVEPHSDSAAVAEQHGIRILADRLESLPDCEAKFDTIVFSFSLEHTEDPVAMLTRARTLLAPRGALFLFTHNFDCVSRLLFGKSWSGWHLPYHTYLFTRGTLSMMLVHAGYRVERIHSYTRPDLLVESFRLAGARLRGAEVAAFAQKGYLIPAILCAALTKPFGFLGFGNSLKAVATPAEPYSPSPAR